jgi:ABC-type branched-subunit amino acid transport system ATPase component
VEEFYIEHDHGGLQARLEEHLFQGPKEIMGPFPDLVVWRGISIVPEGCRIFDSWTVPENLKIGVVNR